MTADEVKMTPPVINRRQREVLDHLFARGALSSEKAHDVFGGDERVADGLAQRGVINKRYASQGATYWIRGEDEPATGSSVPAGFVVVLHRDVTTPTGRAENFFLARATYDGKGTTFRRLLRGWMQALGLSRGDLLGGFMGFELVAPDAPVFDGDHVILDDPAEPLKRQPTPPKICRRCKRAGVRSTWTCRSCGAACCEHLCTFKCGPGAPTTARATCGKCLK